MDERFRSDDPDVFMEFDSGWYVTKHGSLTPPKKQPLTVLTPKNSPFQQLLEELDLFERAGLVTKVKTRPIEWQEDDEPSDT